MVSKPGCSSKENVFFFWAELPCWATQVSQFSVELRPGWPGRYSPGFSACLGWTQSAQIKVSSPHFYEINFSGSLLVIRCLGRKCERGQPINPQRKSGGREERETPWIENFQVTHSKKILVTNKKDPSPAARMVCRSVCPSLQALPSACTFHPISGRREA